MLDEGALRVFADRCGSARQVQEDEFLLAVQAIVQARCTLQTTVEFIGALECRCRLEAAYIAFRALFPHHNYSTRMRAQKGELSERHFVACWTDDASLARYYDACSPALAMLRAVFGELAFQIERERRDPRPDCRGIGWFVAATVASTSATTRGRGEAVQ